LLASFIAGAVGLESTLFVAAAVLAAGAAATWRWPLIDTESMDRSTVAYWPAPALAVEVNPDSGPVVVTETYTIAPRDEQRFLGAMQLVRLSRLRTGATRWGLFRDGEAARRFVELFFVPSWEEHLRQHNTRLTGTDRQFQEQAEALSDPAPTVSHFIGMDLRL
jgi:Transmembrane secretion effector